MADTGTCVILLPEKRFFSGQRLSDAFIPYARRFGLETCEPGESRQLQRHFRCGPGSGWPMAAVCRQHESGDAGAFSWLRADPIYLQAEMRGARVMACGDFALSPDHVISVVSALQPAFANHGFEFFPGSGGSFYIRCPENAVLPDCLPVIDLLGRDLAGQLPASRTWTALFNECQVSLHNHPLNVERQRNGQLPVNGLWFWGGGVLPESVLHDFAAISSADPLVSALVNRTGPQQGRGVLADLRHVRSWPEVESHFDPRLTTLFDFADGTGWRWRPSWRLQFWRRKSIPVF